MQSCTNKSLEAEMSTSGSCWRDVLLFPSPRHSCPQPLQPRFLLVRLYLPTSNKRSHSGMGYYCTESSAGINLTKGL